MTTMRCPSCANAEASVLSSAVPDPFTIVGVAWPTGRPIYRYTPAEIADGVDLYTRALKARARRGGPDASE
ncbi:hypothetical protein C1A38_05500 [Verrucosispora sp. ts21]|nr:hypothetical protein C1A38_05500 [Verrucosispora sp. ts21]